MAKEIIYTELFIVGYIGPINIYRGRDGVDYPTRILHLRKASQIDHNLYHSVFFSRDGVEHTKNIQVGQMVNFSFKIGCSQSRSGAAHTTLNPVKITI